MTAAKVCRQLRGTSTDGFLQAIRQLSVDRAYIAGPTSEPWSHVEITLFIIHNIPLMTDMWHGTGQGLPSASWLTAPMAIRLLT
jgi:hypothetical protein